MFYLCYGEYRGKRTLAAFMRYYRAKERKDAEDAAWRLYMAKGIQLTAHGCSGARLPDLSDLIRTKPSDNRSGDEIAADIIARAGLTMAG